MKKYSYEQRRDIAAKLEGMLGAAENIDEENALRDAIAIVSPEYAAGMAAEEQQAAAWFDGKYPASPDTSGTSAVPPVVNGKILRFGEKKHD